MAVSVISAPIASADDTRTVLEVVAPVLDLVLPTSDLQGVARVEDSEKQVKVTLNSGLLFAKDSARLLPSVRGRLQQVSADLKAKGPGTLRIAGYTDDLGTARHGLVLSRQRAGAVKRALQPLLGPGYRFTVVGKGEEEPAVPNTSEANRKKNRRVVATFVADR